MSNVQEESTQETMSPTMSAADVTDMVGGDMPPPWEPMPFLNGASDTPFIEIDAEADLRIYGTEEQRAALMSAYAQYIGEVQNPKTTKPNPFTKSFYAPLDEVLNATRPVLSKYGLAVLQAPLNGDSNHVYVKTMLLHKSGGMIIFPAFGVMSTKGDAQSTIAALTYARRGALNPILATHGEADDDGNLASGRVRAKPEADGALDDARAKVLAAMQSKAEKVGKDKVFAAMKAKFRTTNPNNLKSVEACNEAMDMLKNMNTEDK